MEKSFSEVFGSLNIKDELKKIFEDTVVERLVVNENKQILKVHISYNRLIIKKYVKELERELTKTVKMNNVSKVIIREKYCLSEQYTPSVWFDNYRDSILLELYEYDNVLYALYKNSDFRFTDEKTLCICVPENPIYKLNEPELIRIIHKIAEDRFGIFFDISIEHKEAEKSRIKAEYEKRAQIKLNEISQSIEKSESGSAEGDNAVQSDSEIANGANDNERTDASKETKKTENSKGKDTSKSEFRRGNKDASKKKGADNFGGENNKYKMVKSDNPDVLYGRDFEGNVIELQDIQDPFEDAVVNGMVLAIDERYIEKIDKHIFKIEISDFTDSLKLKLLLSEEYYTEIKGKIKTGDFIMAKGEIQDDRFDHEIEMSRVHGIKKGFDDRVKRQDISTAKRVELHCHTKMSDMDAVSDVKDIILNAMKFGHTAMAVTDHGNVQAFPLANHAIDASAPFKIIYGLEGYLVDDLQTAVKRSKGQAFSGSFVVFDIETTGFSSTNDRIIEIGAVKIDNMKVVGTFSEFVNPERLIPLHIEKLTSISDDMVKNAPTIDVILPRFIEFCGDSVLVAHNADFDTSFISANAERLGIDYSYSYVDTMGISRYLFTDMAKHTLDALCKKMKLVNEHHHRAVDDANVTAKIFVKMIPMLYEHEIYNLDDLETKGKLSKESIAKLHYYHIILLAKNEIGRRNLYKLVSMSNIDYFHNRPKIPKSKIMELREGLIIGSACERGEIYSGLVRKNSDAEMASLVEFYDYLEIQPIDNNRFQIASDRFPDINSDEDLRDMNRAIVRLGETYNKPVCATCDVHFLNPEDYIYRSIILSSKKMDDETPTPLYFRTTDEMLDEFDYLGSDKAFEVVVTNTNMIADMCEKITPVRPDKCPPVIEDSDKTLRTICYNKAHEMYGDPLPSIVEERLERELNSIIGNGYAVMYIIAQKLVWKSVEDGYLVGSRGSVGSSFVATMAGITEVNPLSPHYYCTNCFYNDFYSEDVKKFAGKAGCDMPDKICPKCGEKLKKDGFDIPFETFLGFKGDKEPDIDLNFSSEYQPKAHKYTEVIFGYGQTFRAGTISGLADKTAYGLVKHYFEDKNIPKREGEITRLAHGCEGVRKTTGQHPGGIVVLPVGEDINSFTALQKPANDMTTDIVTTHFEYHSIDHNLLKLDILGHDDPTMIRMLQDLTGIDPVTIPLDDPKVMSLFQNLDALGLTPEQIGGCKLGSLGIPEFGTDFAMQMLIDTKPQYFSDLVRIAGLSHGTNVWLGNAETLLKEGKATISTAICTRDDIMTYLIGMGLEPSDAFSIMENVRKGKVAKGKCDKWAKWKEDMLAHNVPDWYIWSCERIEYMFPKAHAAAYVMMAWRVAYCKINYPLAYYCSFFSIRSKAFNYEKMCQGRGRVDSELEDLKKASQERKLSANEEALIKDLRIVQEMYARGFSFEPINIYKAKARTFQIIDGKIMPAFVAIEGLGENAAIMLENAAANGEFFSKDEMKARAGIGQSTIDKLSELGLLDGMPQSSQLSIFDLM